MIKNKKKVNISLVLCACLIAALSCFTFISINEKPNNVAYADNTIITYDFQSSYLFYPTAYFENNGFSFICQQFNNFVKFRFHFYTYSDGFYHFEFDDLVIYNVNAVDDSQLYSYNCLVRDSNTGELYDTISFDSTNKREFYLFTNDSDTLQYPWYSFGFFTIQVSSLNLSPNFVSLTMKTIPYNNEYGFVNLVYKDEAGESLTVNIAYSIQDTTSVVYTLPERTYYFTPEMSDNMIYQQGYNAGLSDNQSSIYQSGYKAGETIGYNKGYNVGLEDTNQYTFLNLVSATIDAPFHYFTSLFGFELLGVNLQSFLMALFTICVVITIINMVRK